MSSSNVEPPTESLIGTEHDISSPAKIGQDQEKHRFNSNKDGRVQQTNSVGYQGDTPQVSSVLALRYEQFHLKSLYQPVCQKSLWVHPGDIQGWW